uniref:Uncharacterized protein n=1 Tax=Pinctada fucata TaxID=50426 RepID=A0A194ANM5_PINFU
MNFYNDRLGVCLSKRETACSISFLGSDVLLGMLETEVRVLRPCGRNPAKGDTEPALIAPSPLPPSLPARIRFAISGRTIRPADPCSAPAAARALIPRLINLGSSIEGGKRGRPRNRGGIRGSKGEPIGNLGSPRGIRSRRGI